MAESKSSRYKVFLESVPPLAGANLLFFCLEFILAVEVRSVSLFSDSIVFLEGAAVSVLTAPRIKWGVPGRDAFGRFTGTMFLIPMCFMFWMIAANYDNAEIPSAVPLAATGAVLLLTNIACLVVLNCWAPTALTEPLFAIRNHAVMNAAIIGAAFLTWGSGTMWPDVMAGLGILYMNADAAEHVWHAAKQPPTRGV
jgi:Co/Zn/Cd efflux system component